MIWRHSGHCSQFDDEEELEELGTSDIQNYLSWKVSESRATRGNFLFVYLKICSNPENKMGEILHDERGSQVTIILINLGREMNFDHLHNRNCYWWLGTWNQNNIISFVMTGEETAAQRNSTDNSGIFKSLTNSPAFVLKLSNLEFALVLEYHGNN